MQDINKVVHIVNFSGGKDSTAMLLKMLENNYPIDYILFCDTGVEFPETYKHIELVERKLAQYGLQISVLKPKHSFLYWVTEHKRSRGKYKGLPYAFPSWKNRWCTPILKLAPTKKFEKQFLRTGVKIVSYIGYSLNELKRYNKMIVKSSSNKEYCFPLITDFKMTSEDCLNYCYNLGFDWNGAYNYVRRLSCYTCPFARLNVIKFLINEHPELWNKIKQVEWQLKELGLPYWKFRSDYSCSELENLCKVGF